MKKILMSRGADKVVSTCVKVQPGEEVVIITEESKMRIAEMCIRDRSDEDLRL